MIPSGGVAPPEMHEALEKALEGIERPARVPMVMGKVQEYQEDEDGTICGLKPPVPVWFVDVYRTDADGKGRRDRVAMTDRHLALSVANRSWWVEATHRFLEAVHERRMAVLKHGEGINDQLIREGGPVFGRVVGGTGGASA